MAVGQRWLDENLGAARSGTPAVPAPEVARQVQPDPALERIEFKSEGPEGEALRARGRRRRRR